MKETLRVLRPGGQAGFTTWKQIAWWPMAIAAMKAAFPEAPAMPPVERLILKGYDKPSVIEEKLKESGFEDISIHEYEFSLGLDSDRFGTASGTLAAMATSKLWSKEDIEKYGTPPKMIGAIKDYLNSNFEGGVWDGKMPANIVTARKAR